jgi:hypothetical protein
MKPKFRLLLTLLCLPFLGMAGKPRVAVRFYVEANAQDTDKFASPVKLQNPPRDVFIERLPRINEKMIRAIYPFQAADGTSGCSFKLDDSGRLDLEVLSNERRGGIIVPVIVTKAGGHRLTEMLIDKPIHDGIITIQFGLTAPEIAALTKEFKVIKPKKPSLAPPHSDIPGLLPEH